MRVHFRFSRRRTHCDFVQLAQEFWGMVGDPGSNPSVFAGLVPASRHTGCDLEAKRAVNEYGRDGRLPLPIRPDLPGRTMARIGLRMMPPFPWSPLKFRTARFPQYGFKAGVSGGAFPAARGLPQRSVCHRPSCTSLIAFAPRSVPGNALRWCTSVRAASATAG